MGTAKWIYCPICKNKTRTKIRTDTKLINFPLYCPKCKQENLINASKLKITVIKEPDCVFRLNGTACTLQREGCPLQTGSF